MKVNINIVKIVKIKKINKKYLIVLIITFILIFEDFCNSSCNFSKMYFYFHIHILECNYVD